MIGCLTETTTCVVAKPLVNISVLEILSLKQHDVCFFLSLFFNPNYVGLGMILPFTIVR